MRKPLLLIAVLGLLLCSVDLFYIVEEGDQAVIMQFRRPVEAVTEAGLHVKVPFLQTARFFDQRVLAWKSGGMEITTVDNMPVVVEATARWRINRPLVFTETLGTYEQAYARLDGAIPSALKAHARESSLADFVRPSASLKTLDPAKGGTTPASLSEVAGKPVTGSGKILEDVRLDASKALEGLGIELVDVKIRRIAFGQKVRSLVYERMTAERKARAEALRSEGEGKKAELSGLMEKELQILRSEAFKTSEEIRGKADAEAAAIYGRAYNQDPEFYSFLKTLETYKGTSFENTTLILGTDTDFYKFLKGPSK